MSSDNNRYCLFFFFECLLHDMHRTDKTLLYWQVRDCFCSPSPSFWLCAPADLPCCWLQKKQDTKGGEENETRVVFTRLPPAGQLWAGACLMQRSHSFPLLRPHCPALSGPKRLWSYFWFLFTVYTFENSSFINFFFPMYPGMCFLIHFNFTRRSFRSKCMCWTNTHSFIVSQERWVLSFVLLFWS